MIKLKKRLIKLDRINHESHPKSAKGLIFTIVSLCGVVGYGTWMAVEWAEARLEAESRYEWSTMKGPCRARSSRCT